MKFGWGDHFAQEDKQRLAAIRCAIGPEIRLMVAFGCPAFFSSGVSPKSAARIAKTLEEYDVYFLEEPLPPFDAEGHAELAKEAKTFIATGEMLCHKYEFNRFFDRHAVDVIHPRLPNRSHAVPSRSPAR